MSNSCAEVTEITTGKSGVLQNSEYTYFGDSFINTKPFQQNTAFQYTMINQSQINQSGRTDDKKLQCVRDLQKNNNIRCL